MKTFTKLLLIIFISGCVFVLPTKEISARKQMPNISVETAVKPIGDFSNIGSNGEHQWGYSVELWRQGDKIYGLISGDDNSRIIGDPPTGILENVRFNTTTNKISFSAKLPAQKTFEFEGVLTIKKLEGERIITRGNCSEKCSEEKKIILWRSKESSSEMLEYQTFAEWKALADEILAFRGPKNK